MAVINAVGNSLTGRTGTGSFVGSASPTLTGTLTAAAIAATSINFGGGALSVYTPNASFSPTFTFAVPGDLSVSYATQSGTYYIIGGVLFFTVELVFTPTFTTSSGSPRIGGFPASAATSANSIPIAQHNANITYLASRTYIMGRSGFGNSFLVIIANGSGQSGSNIAASNFTSGVSTTITASGSMFI